MFQKFKHAINKKGNPPTKLQFELQVNSVEGFPDNVQRCRVVFERSAKLHPSEVQPVKGIFLWFCAWMLILVVLSLRFARDTPCIY